MNQQVKAGIAAVRDFLAGRSGEAKAAHPTDKATRQEVAAELLGAMAGKADRGPTTDDRQTSADAGPLSSDSQQTANQAAEQERARRLFVEHGYFDEAVETLRGAESSAERVIAARSLGLVGSQRGTAHLIAAMFDDDAEVRTAAEEALAKIGDPTSVKTSPKQDEKKVKVAEASANAPVKSQEPTGPSTQASHPSPGSGPAKSTSSEKSIKAAQVSTKTSTPSEEKVDPAGHRSSQTQTVREQGKPQAKSKDAAPAKSKVVEPKESVVPAPQPAILQDASVSEEEKELFQQEQASRKTLADVQQKLKETAATIPATQNEARWRAERESKLRADAAARQRQEEELRKKAEEEAAGRRLQEAEAINAEVSARVEAEAQEQRLVKEQTRLWLKAATLRHAAEEHSRKRMELEFTRHQTAEAAERVAAQGKRQQAEAQHATDVQRLRSEEENLRKASDEAAKHRAEVEAARERAERDAEKLLEAQARMRTAEEMRAKAEAQRVKLEAELLQLVETEERRLVEARRHAQEEDARLQKEAHIQAEAQQKRLAELEVAREKSEEEHKQRLERERVILSEIDSLRIADAEARKRIAEAEAREHTAEQAYRSVADKVQRFEAEAHAAALAEEQILAKLETARRSVANEAQARADQEKRIKEEIEMFRRLEEEERPRIEALTLQRAAAEARLQEQRERLNAEEEARARAEEQIKQIEAFRSEDIIQTAELSEDTFEDLAPHLPAVEVAATVDVGPAIAAQSVEATAGLDVPPAIASYLHSVDPYKRAAAVAELARSQSPDAFTLIARCFDDHSPHVRNAAARALRKLDPHKTVDLFNRAIDEGSEERRRNIGSAIAASGVAGEAIDNLVSESREDTYNALSVLFVMAKSGELDPLVQAIEEHANDEVCRAAIKLLTLSGNSEVGDAALQRRVMGVPASRNKQVSDRRNEIPDFRLRIAEVEVKRAINSQQPTSRKPTPDSEEQTAFSGNE
ncbi:MAG: HEAT repeat domain-containing protein [Acidobacteriota bacterium]|nr:HEAT repeat domain-containing protein [Acidobacteriota bacterium]